MDDLISRQKAINTANALYAKCDTGDITDLRDMIVAGLDCLPSADVVPAGAYKQTAWERDAAIEQLKELGYSLGEKVRRGHWIHIRTEEDGNALYECSVCHKGEIHVPIVEVSYCWNCGARMDGEYEAN